MSAEVETMFSALETPWHKLGTVTDGVLTANDALVTAGLDWRVELKDLWYQSNIRNEAIGNKELMQVPDKYAVVRDSDNSCLGTVGSKYTPLQNRDAFTFMDNIVDSGEAKYETAGSLFNGKNIWILMNLENVEGISQVDGDDIKPYMLLSNSHDGSSALKVTMTPIRVVCNNTLRMALKGANQQISVRHTSGISNQVDYARQSLGLVVDYYSSFQEQVERMIDQEVADEKFYDILEKLFPRPSDEEMEKPRVEANYKNKIANIKSNYVQETHVGTAWGVFNAFNSYELWDKKVRGNALERQASNFIHDNQTISNRVKSLLEV
jgi:phage/plasmid-like protein (TIGR03299 family)